MTEQEIKDRIRESFREQTPELLERIEASLEQMSVDSPSAPEDRSAAQEVEATKAPSAPEQQKRARVIPVGAILKRAAVVAACFIFLLCGILVGRIPAPVPAAEAAAYIYLDVNPSIEIAVDESDRVTACTPANDDAREVLSELSLVGVDMNTAISAIVGSMYVNGYLTESSNSILISVDSSDEAKTTELISKTTDRINSVFEKATMSCSIIAQSVTATEELIQKAAEKGVSIGKMHLVNKMADILDNPDEIAPDELVEMSIGELNLMYSTAHKGGEDGGAGEGKPSFDKDVVSGSVNGYLTTEDASRAALEHLGLTEAEVKSVIAKAIAKRDGNKRVMVYSVWVVPKDYSAIYELTLDCVDCEVLSEKTHSIGLGDLLSGLGGLGGIDLPESIIKPEREDENDMQKEESPSIDNGPEGGEPTDDKSAHGGHEQPEAGGEDRPRH